MDSLALFAVTGAAALIISIAIARTLIYSDGAGGAAAISQAIAADDDSPEVVKDIAKKLESALGEACVLSRGSPFAESTRGHWAEQECEKKPACIVRPWNSQQVCKAVAIIHEAWSELGGPDAAPLRKGIFAVRSGGHSPVSGAASIKGGILIDLSLMNEVAVAQDRKSVSVGAGARWIDVSSALDKERLATVGGRNSQVGVGGLTLGGGISYFSPQHGLVCSNVLEFEIVLASGDLKTVSPVESPDLCRALKGGANNFGVVTRFKFRCFPTPSVWSGFLYMPSFQANKALAAFHQSVSEANPSRPTFDKRAAGVILSFTYLQSAGFQVVAANLAYTHATEGDSKWPSYWKSSAFSSIWRLWSTCKPRTLTSATDELAGLNPAGRRQALAATTVLNDAATIAAAHSAYREAISTVRRVKGISWTLVLQPLMPEWASKEDSPNSLGLDKGPSEPLVIVSLTINWGDAKDDDFVNAEVRRVIEKVEAFAIAHDTWHPYRYLNYCASWQDPFSGYGDENQAFLRKVSAKYDETGLFQRACAGGFKLWN